MQVYFYKRPLIPLTMAMIAGIVAGLQYPDFPVCGTVAAITSLAAVIGAGIASKRLTVVPLILFFSIGYLLIIPYLDTTLPENHIAMFSGDKAVKITGQITKGPYSGGHRRLAILDTEQIEDKSGENIPVTGRLRVSIYGEVCSLMNGDTISFTGKIRRFRNFKNPGGFNYVRYMQFQGIYAGTFTRSDRVEIIRKGDPTIVYKSRDGVARMIDHQIRDRDTGAVLKALIIGERREISEQLEQAFSHTGTRHLLAISGLHIGIVAGGAFLLFCMLLTYLPPVLHSGRIFMIAGLLAMIPVIGYGSLAGMAPSTRRAVIMAAVVLISYSVKREHDLFNTLTLAAFAILVVSPVFLFSASFQLSFAAVTIILFGLPLLNSPEDTLMPRQSRMGNIARSCFIISTLAFAGTLPLVLYYFNEISLIGIAVNVVMIPVIGFLVVPSALLSVLLMPVSSFLAGIVIRFSGSILKTALWGLQRFAEIPYASVTVVTPSVFEILLYYLLLITILHFLKKREIPKKGWLLLTVLLVLIVVDIGWQVRNRFFDRELEVTIIDVGQGAAALIEFPGGKTMLIDGGGFQGRSAFDTGKGIIAPFLWQRKIGTIDTVVLTHPENDHIKGLNYILENFRVQSVWSNGQKADIVAYRTFLSIIRERQIPHDPFTGQIRTVTMNGVTVEILYPPAGFRTPLTEEGGKDYNNASIVIKLTYRDCSILFTGDIMAAAESELIQFVGTRLESNVMIVPHHGSRTSSTEDFIEAVDPDIAVFSAGFNNRFRMPHPSVLNRYRERGCRIFRTDLDGAVRIRTSDQGLEISSFGSPRPRVFPGRRSLKNR